MSTEKNIPEGWVEEILGNVGILARGKSKHRPRWASHLFGGAYPFIQTGQVKLAEKYIVVYERTYSEAGLAQSKLWDKDTLCITIAANIAEIAILKFPACFPDSVLGFIADNEKADLNFIYYNFSMVQAKLRQLSTGSVQNNINLGTFERVKFLLPPIEEQKAIAAILTAFDDKIENLQAQNKTLETTAQTIFKEWFGKYQVGDDLPDGWRVGKLGDLTEKISKGTTPRKKDLEGLKIEVPFLKVKDISKKGLIIKDNLQLIPKEVHQKQLKRSVLKTNDILFSIAGTIGRVAIIDNELSDSNCNQALAFIRLINKVIFFEYVYLWFKSKEVQNEIKNSIVQGVQANVSLTVLNNLAINIPNELVLKRWKELINPIYDKIVANNTQIQTLKKTRDTLLPKLMSGQLRVDTFKN